jgi:hypothetical protein
VRRKAWDNGAQRMTASCSRFPRNVWIMDRTQEECAKRGSHHGALFEMCTTGIPPDYAATSLNTLLHQMPQYPTNAREAKNRNPESVLAPSACLQLPFYRLNNAYLAISGPNRLATKHITVMRVFKDGPAVSLNGSPTVSPTTAALCASEPFPP